MVIMIDIFIFLIYGSDMKYLYKNERFVNQTKIRVTSLFIFFLFCKAGVGQSTSANTLLVSSSSNDSLLTLNYEPLGMVNNLLVQINDSGGRTIFIDNKYRFSGNYQAVYDVSLWKADVVYVQLIADEKHFNKRVRLR